MEKKNTSPTVAEQKQILETCVHKLEEVNACILAMYPTLSTNLPLSDYTNEELIAHELCEDKMCIRDRYNPPCSYAQCPEKNSPENEFTSGL